MPLYCWVALFPACILGSAWLASVLQLGQAAVKTGFLPMSGRSRAQREVVETSTDGEARIIINSPEDLQAGLDRLTFVPFKEKKGAIKAYLFTKCLPRVLENLVDDEDDD